MRPKTKFYLSLAILQVLLIFIVLFSINGLITFVAAQGEGKIDNPATAAMVALAAAISVAASTFASAWALKTVGTAAISSITEREGGSIVIQFLSIAMCEALAIYGFIVAVLLWTLI
jgi:F0F1-type ATP synthase membrane subunit c/vacuolar-type H+-ATPase subunit K